MPTQVRTRETVHVFDYTIHNVAYIDGYGVVTLTDDRTGDWDGHITQGEHDSVVLRLRALVELCQTQTVRRTPKRLIEAAVAGLPRQTRKELP
jgi:hypothetical protein